MLKNKIIFELLLLIENNFIISKKKNYSMLNGRGIVAEKLWKRIKLRWSINNKEEGQKGDKSHQMAVPN